MAADNKLFQIRSKTTGLFSGGTGTPTFTKKGKIWKGMGPLKSHLRLFCGMLLKDANGNYVKPYKLVNQIPEDWEVVEIQFEIISRQDANALYPKLIDY